MRFTSLVIKNVVRRRARSATTVAGVAIAIATVVALVGTSVNFQRAFRQTYHRRNVDLVVLEAGAAQGLNSALDESLGPRIRQLPGVREVIPGLIEVVAYEDLELYGVLVHGWEPDSVILQGFRMLEGRRLQAGDRRQVMLGHILAKNMGLHAGDRFDVIEGEPFDVVGVYESFSVYENGGMIMPLDELQDMLGWGDQVTGFTVLAENPDDRAAIARLADQIESLAPGLSAMSVDEHVAHSAQMRAAQGMAWIISLIALAIGAVGMLNTMLMSVLERIAEIGVLRAIGWRPARVVGLILSESMVLSAAGAVVGIVGGMLATAGLSALPSTSGFVDPRVPLLVVFEAFAVALGVGLLGGAYPAYRGASMLPAQAIRTE